MAAGAFALSALRGVTPRQPATAPAIATEAALTPFFVFPPDRPVSDEGRRKASAYLTRLAADATTARAIAIVCPSDRARTAELARNLKLVIDGRDDDWAGIPPSVVDGVGNANVFLEDKPSRPATPAIDLTEVRCLLTDQELYLCFRPRGRPDEDDVSYWLQIYNEAGELSFSVVAIGKTVFGQTWKDNKVIAVTPVSAEQGQTAAGDVFEVRVARSALPPLPDVFVTEAGSYSEPRNRINFTPRFTVREIRYQASTTPAWLLARYAEKTDLLTAGYVPLALAVQEAFLIENIHPELRERVVSDGVAMIEASRSLKDRLDGLPFEAVLAWANRGMQWGASGMMLDERGRITREAYEFMYLDPALLADVRSQLQQQGLGKEPTVRETAEAVDAWALSKNKYRWKPEVLAEWSRTLPNREFWLKLHADTLEDIQAGRDKVCLVNGKQIEFYIIGSPRVGWDTYRRTGHYYGCCGDVAVVSGLGMKSLGVPDIAFFRRLGPTEALTHTFIGFHDRAESVWRTPRGQLPPTDVQPHPGSMLQVTLPGLTERLPFTRETDTGGGVTTWVSARSPVMRLTPREMHKRLEDGLSHEEFCRLLYAQLDRDAEKP